MAQQVINVGTTANDGTGDTLRVSQQKANANFTELYEGKLESVVAGTNVSINNTDPLNPVINVTGGSGGGGSQTLQDTMELGRIYVETVGTNDYAFGFNDDEFVVDLITNTGQFSHVAKGNQIDTSISAGTKIVNDTSDLINGKNLSALSEFGQNTIKIPFKTSGSGDAVFQVQNNKPAGTYDLAITDDIPDVDATPTNGSANPVSSNGVFDALELKQRNLFDFQTKEGFYLFEDFLGNGVPTTSVMWGGESSGAGSSIVTVNNYPNRTNQQGVLRFATGTTSTGLAQKRLGDNNSTSHYLGNGIYTLQFFVNIETLSTSSERFYSIFGATTNAAFGNTNGIFFIYDEGVGTYGTASPNWKCITRNSTITSTITTIPVVASQWYVLKIVVNANASSVQFYIDNVLVATHTTNIVTIITPRVAHVKTVGTTSRNAYVDYSLVQQIYTTPRTI